MFVGVSSSITGLSFTSSSSSSSSSSSLSSSEDRTDDFVSIEEEGKEEKKEMSSSVSKEMNYEEAIMKLRASSSLDLINSLVAVIIYAYRSFQSITVIESHTRIIAVDDGSHSNTYIFKNKIKESGLLASISRIFINDEINDDEINGVTEKMKQLAENISTAAKRFVEIMLAKRMYSKENLLSCESLFQKHCANIVGLEVKVRIGIDHLKTTYSKTSQLMSICRAEEKIKQAFEDLKVASGKLPYGTGAVTRKERSVSIASEEEGEIVGSSHVIICKREI